MKFADSNIVLTPTAKWFEDEFFEKSNVHRGPAGLLWKAGFVTFVDRISAKWISKVWKTGWVHPRYR